MAQGAVMTSLSPWVQQHPADAELERFLRSELSRPAARSIVRHLLTGCSRCQRVTRRLWELGEGAR